MPKLQAALPEELQNKYIPMGRFKELFRQVFPKKEHNTPAVIVAAEIPKDALVLE